jgi:hypothetical protein
VVLKAAQNFHARARRRAKLARPRRSRGSAAEGGAPGAGVKVLRGWMWKNVKLAAENAKHFPPPNQHK